MMEPERIVLPAVTGADVDTLARTLWGEARGEGRGGMEDVAATIRNRVHLDLKADLAPDWWGEGYAGVCRRPKQFSCWNVDDPNLPKLLKVTELEQAFATAYEVAIDCVHWRFPDRTLGSTHYVVAAILATLPDTHWARVATVRYRAGRHVFFKL